MRLFKLAGGAARLRPLCAAWVLAIASAVRCSAITPDDPGPSDVRFTVDSTSGARPISPYIYGMNSFSGSSLTNPVTLDRLGGNRWTGYNWETNASNAGADWYHHSDNYLVSGSNTPPGQAVRPALNAAAANNRALVVTVPMAGYVAADTNGTVDETQAAPSVRWKEVAAKKGSVYPGEPLSLTPNETDGYVFTDEFVHWVDSTRQPGQRVFYSLDNEPGLWGEPLPPGWQSGDPPGGAVVQPSSGGRTHPLIHPYAPTFAEMKAKTIAHASAIKDVNPEAVVFGGVAYGWNEFTTLQDSPGRVTAPAHPGGDRTGELHYYEWLLNEVAKEESAQGRTLMDVLDLHWYPEAQGGGTRITGNNNSAAVVAARVQAPRSLWDPTYVETSWISQWSTWVGSPGNPGPVTLLPRVQRDIDDFKSGTKIAITEYNYGGTNHISGAIAQADALGIFGQEDLFAATFWSLHGDSQSQFVSGAFKMYLDYDGEGGSFGDTFVEAATDSIAKSAIYASVDEGDPDRMVLVAINRTATPQTTSLMVTHDRRFDLAEVYQLTSASAVPVRAADISIELVNAFQYTMPAYSISTLVLRATTPLAGDFNGDGTVDAADLAVWRENFGTTTSATFARGDNDGDGDVDGADFLGWQQALGAGRAVGQTAVPEPSTVALISAFGAMVTLARGARRDSLREENLRLPPPCGEGWGGGKKRRRGCVREK
jgi:hypothetical protein